MESVYIPSPADSEYVELSRSPKGRLFRKEILHVNDSFMHPGVPGSKITVTPSMAENLVRNFREKVCPIVQVPMVNEKNQHVEDPSRNIGEVVDLTFDDKGVYAVMDVRKPEYAAELGNTLIGASAMMHLNYTDTRSGETKGPTLLHVAVTNRPYIRDLAGFEEIVAASADTLGETRPVVLTPADSLEEGKMELDELLEVLKTEHNVDVVDLQAKAEKVTETEKALTALSSVLGDAGVVKLSSEDGLDLTDVAKAVVELSNDNREMASILKEVKEESDKIKLSSVEAEVDKLVHETRILPSMRDAYLELALSNREMFDKLVPDSGLVALSEVGVETHDEPASATVDEYIDKYANTKAPRS